MSTSPPIDKSLSKPLQSWISAFTHGSTQIPPVHHIPSDVLANQIIQFLDMTDVTNLKIAYPNLEIGRRADENMIIRFLKRWNRRKKLLDSTKFRTLLDNVDPSFGNNYLIRWAAATGFDELVELLSHNKRVDIHAGNNWAFILAKENKHASTVKLLKEIDPEFIDDHGTSESLLIEIINSDTDSITKLIQSQNDLDLLFETSKRARDHIYDGFLQSIISDKMEIMEFLLCQTFLDASSRNFEAIFEASKHSNKDILEKIWRSGKIKPFENCGRSLLVTAIRKNDSDLAQFILENSESGNPLSNFFWSPEWRQKVSAARKSFSILLYHTEMTPVRLKLKEIVEDAESKIDAFCTIGSISGIILVIFLLNTG